MKRRSDSKWYSAQYFHDLYYEVWTMVGLNLDVTFEEYMYYARRSMTNFAMKQGQQMNVICAFPFSAFCAFRASSNSSCRNYELLLGLFVSIKIIWLGGNATLIFHKTL